MDHVIRQDESAVMRQDETAAEGGGGAGVAPAGRELPSSGAPTGIRMEQEESAMAHVTPALWSAAEAALGRPAERTWQYPITPGEMEMVVSSTRGQRRLHDVTLFIFNGDGRLALIRKQNYPPGAWRAPGGGIAPGETFAQGACREALEETGLAVTLTGYLLRVFVTFTCGQQTQPWTTHVVTARAAEGPLATRDPREIEAVTWGTLADLTGPVAEVMLRSGRGLFTYRVALHREVARLLGQPQPGSV